MAKQRDRVKMSDAEIWSFLEGSKSLNVATLDKDGSPHLTTLWFAVHDGNVLFETYGKSQKVLNLRRDPRISALCEAGTEYNELRGVSIKGHAEIIDQAPRLQELMAVVLKHNNPNMSAEQL